MQTVFTFWLDLISELHSYSLSIQYFGWYLHLAEHLPLSPFQWSRKYFRLAQIYWELTWPFWWALQSSIYYNFMNKGEETFWDDPVPFVMPCSDKPAKGWLGSCIPCLGSLRDWILIFCHILCNLHYCLQNRSDFNVFPCSAFIHSFGQKPLILKVVQSV